MTHRDHNSRLCHFSSVYIICIPIVMCRHTTNSCIQMLIRVERNVVLSWFHLLHIVCTHMCKANERIRKEGAFYLKLKIKRQPIWKHLIQWIPQPEQRNLKIMCLTVPSISIQHCDGSFRLTIFQTSKATSDFPFHKTWRQMSYIIQDIIPQ
jgi:hypothetical protein